MEVILLEKIRNLGKLGDTVKVKPGYGRNYLVPGGKAVYATTKNKALFDARRVEFEERAKAGVMAAEDRKQRLLALGIVTLKAKAGEEGKLFGSIGARDIALAITDLGVDVKKSEVFLPIGLLRQVGDYEVNVEFHSEVVATIKILVTSE